MFRVIAFVGVVLFLITGSVTATVIHVPGDSTTIQGGINGANDGDTVLVAPGIYQEHINFLGKAILVTSEAGAESTIVEKQFDGISMVYFENGEDTTSIFCGFTVRNATATGIKCIDSSPIIKNCIIENNATDPNEYQGGGITIRGGLSYPVIKNNIIRFNTAIQGSGCLGGGVLNHGAHAIIDSNIIYGNLSAYGGAIDGHSGSFRLSNNIIFDNKASGDGGAICMAALSSCTISNNTISDNQAIDNSGGILLSSCSDIEIKNNIVTNNDVYGIYVRTSSNIHLRYNCIFGNESGEFYGVLPEIGNIYVDPLFLSPESSDYSLMSNSPCIDAGDPESPYDPDGTRADMGALYFDQTYRILNFHLIEPQTDSVYLTTPAQFIWHSTTDIDSGYTVYYTHYIDDNLLFDSPDSSGELEDTTFILPDTLDRSTLYYWRVLAYNYYATPIYSEETWNLYIDGYPTIPTIIAPENGAVVDSSTYLAWIIGTDPDPMDTVTYALQVDDNPLFNSPEIDVSGITESGLILEEAVAVMLGNLIGFDNLQEGIIYYWRVRSDDLFGLSSEFTDGTNYFSYGININDPPFPPTSGFSPTNGEEIISLTPVITWNYAVDPDPDDNATNLSYAIRLSQDSTFSGFVYYDSTDPGINQIQPTDSLEDNSHYFYGVMTIDDEGLASEWSATQNFWTNHYNYPPEPFPLYSPEDDIRRVDYYTYFTWGNTIDYDPLSNFEFTFQYSPDSLFEGLVTSITGITDTILTIPTDTLELAGEILFWRVLAVDDDSLIRIGGIPEPETRSITIVTPGDANGDGQILGSDVTYLVRYFKGINPPPDPLLAGDTNSDCELRGNDVTYLVQYFKGYTQLPVRGDCEQPPVLLGRDIDKMGR